MIKSILIAGIVGGLTGFIAHLIRNKRVMVLPKRRQRPKGIDLGFIADLLIGSAAAVFVSVYLGLHADDLQSLIAVSILAGLSAEAILLHRMLTVEQIKQKELDKIIERLLKKK